MSPTFAEGTVRVSTPPSYDAHEPVATKGLPDPADLPALAVKGALVRALHGSGLELAQSVDLTPRLSKDLGAPKPGQIKLEVDVPHHQDAVVLLERDGVYSWHLPTDKAGRVREIGKAKGTHTRHFAIAVEPNGTRDRGLLGHLVQGAAQALVFKYVAPPLVDKAIDHMEAHVKPGLLHLTGPDVHSWKRFETLGQLHLPTNRPVRVLLFIHGTFSSTAGGFGALAVGENGPGFLRTAISTYDAVIGFDHKTLSVDPLQNAEALLTRLQDHQPKSDFVIDVITHSRGGLVTRSFVEQVLPSSGWPARVDNIVFVASTNGGTHLADPERWSDMVDLYTNLAAVSAHVLTLAGAAPVAAVVSGVVQGIGALVKYLVSYAAEGDEVPGLKAMVPGGAFVTEINKMQKGQPQPGTSWFVVTSDFHVSLFDDHHNPPEFPKELAVKLKEGFVDGLFHGDNDLVVDTESMSAIGLPTGGFVRDTFALGKNDVVYHNNYFAQASVIEAIAGWLPLGLGAGGGESVAAALPPASPPPPPPPRPLDSDPVPTSIAPGSARRMAPSRALEAPRPMPSSVPMQRQPQIEELAAMAAPAPMRTVLGPDPEPETTTATLAAEMPGHVVVAKEYAVRVRLSRNAVTASDDAVHVEQKVEVDESRPLSVHVVGKSNAEIIGIHTDLFALPPGGGTSELQFKVQAPAAGTCVVSMVVKQGAVPIANLRLEATAVDAADVATMPADTTSAGTALAGIDAPELEGLPCIDIFERAVGSNSVIYQYAVRIETEKTPFVFESLPMADREQKIAAFLDDVAKAWHDADAEPAERERRLQDIGSKMFDELFPPDMQAYLWKHRTKVKDLIVYADEPFVPWELVHLKPPTGPRQQAPRFLAQGGLVRWQPGSFPPKEMHVRRGRARTLVPDYKDPMYVLPETALERDFVEQRFHATDVTATPTAARALLRSGDFDLLHFSGHGAAHLDDVLDARLLLQGLKRGGTVQPQYLGATTVSENTKWATKGESGPVVVLNACQVGQAGELLTTVGGFAKAFLDAGASAFVSCLWSVGDQPSRLFVEKLYDELLAGTQISLASARARQAARRAGDPTWLAFVVYARPDAVLVTS